MKKIYSIIVLIVIVALLNACGFNEHNSLEKSEKIQEGTMFMAEDGENKKYNDSTKETEADYEKQIIEVAEEYLNAFAQYDARGAYKLVSSDLDITIISLDDIMGMFNVVDKEENRFQRKFLFEVCEELLLNAHASIDSIVVDEQNCTAKVEFTVNRPDIIKAFVVLYSEQSKNLTEEEIKQTINQETVERQILVGELNFKTEDGKWVVNGMTTEGQ